MSYATNRRFTWHEQQQDSSIESEGLGAEGLQLQVTTGYPTDSSLFKEEALEVLLIVIDCVRSNSRFPASPFLAHLLYVFSSHSWCRQSYLFVFSSCFQVLGWLVFPFSLVFRISFFIVLLQCVSFLHFLSAFSFSLSILSLSSFSILFLHSLFLLSFLCSFSVLSLSFLCPFSVLFLHSLFKSHISAPSSNQCFHLCPRPPTSALITGAAMSSIQKGDNTVDSRAWRRFLQGLIVSKFFWCIFEEMKIDKIV